MLNRLCVVLALSVSLILICGCASTHQYVALPDQSRIVDDSGKCRIYVFRPESMNGGKARMTVKDGKRVIGDLGMQSYLCWERDPGKVAVLMDFYTIDGFVINMREDLDAQPGAIYYLRAGLLNPFSSAPDRLDTLYRISDEEGKQFLKKCKPPPLSAPK